VALILVTAFLFALIMAVFAAAGGGRASPASNFLGMLVSPIQNGVDSIRNQISEWYGYVAQYDAYKKENEQLRIKIAQMEEAARQSEAANDENERLRKLLDLSQKRRDFKFVSAQIVARDVSNWASTLTIGKGTSQGVEAGQCVINEEGFLVGFVSETGLNWATVTTLIDTDMEAGAIIFRTQFTAVAEGDFTLMQEGKLKLTYLPRDTDILIGDKVLTSGAGGKFPKDLVIGEIEQVETEKNGISEYAVIKPSVNLDEITQVFVIKSFEIEE
jgi:rod shape-determining protein MreC